MLDSANTATITIGPARISYHHLITPYSHNSGDDKKYSVTMLIPKNDSLAKKRMDEAIEVALEKGVQSKWNGVKPAKPAIPVYDGDGVRSNGEPFGPEAAGCFVLTASSFEQVEIVDAALQPIVTEKEIYRGAYIYASVTFFSYARSGKKGIGCGLNAVLKFKDGEPLGGRLTAARAFAPLIRQLATNDTDVSN